MSKMVWTVAMLMASVLSMPSTGVAQEIHVDEDRSDVEIIGNTDDYDSASDQLDESEDSPAQVNTHPADQRPAIEGNGDRASIEGSPDNTRPRLFGIGIHIGARIISPDDINEFTADIFDELKPDNAIVTSTFGSTDVFMAFPIRVKMVVNPIPYLGIEPYGQLLFTSKMLKISKAGSQNVLLFNPILGTSVYARFRPMERISVKLGGGATYSWLTLTSDGDLGEVELTGSSLGGEGLAGIDISFSRIRINIDVSVPIQTVSLDIEGENELMSVPPEKAALSGFEIRPGMTIYF